MFAVGGRRKCISAGDTVGVGVPRLGGLGGPFYKKFLPQYFDMRRERLFFLPASEQRAQVNVLVVREVE